MNQRERKKRTAKTGSAVKTVEKAETVKVEQTKKAVVKAAKAEKVYNTRLRINWTSCAGCTWNFMETAPCSQNYVTRCTASMKNVQMS